jgi:hypothetical protein
MADIDHCGGEIRQIGICRLAADNGHRILGE